MSSNGIHVIEYVKYKTNDGRLFDDVNNAAIHALIDSSTYNCVLNKISHIAIPTNQPVSDITRRVLMSMLIDNIDEINRMVSQYHEMCHQTRLETVPVDIDENRIRDSLENAWNCGRRHSPYIDPDETNVEIIDARTNDVRKILTNKYGVM